MPDARVVWNDNEVQLFVEQAGQKMLEKIAFQMEGRVKVQIRDNGQIDTGFMVNSVYVVTPDSSGFSAASHEAESKADRVIVEEDLSGEGAMVVVGASYAIYQEARKSFLYAGAQQVADEIRGL